MKRRPRIHHSTLNNPLLILTTTASLREAQKLARLLLQKRLAGCVNLIPRVNSLYWWQGKVEKAREVLLLIKTTQPQVKPLSRFLKKIHSYDVPEILAVPIHWGDEDYLSWLNQSLKKV